MLRHDSRDFQRSRDRHIDCYDDPNRNLNSRVSDQSNIKINFVASQTKKKNTSKHLEEKFSIQLEYLHLNQNQKQK